MRQVSLGTRIHPHEYKSGTAQRGHILQAGPPSLSAGRCDWNSHKNSRNWGGRHQHQLDTATETVIKVVLKDGSVRVNRFSFCTLVQSMWRQLKWFNQFLLYGHDIQNGRMLPDKCYSCSEIRTLIEGGWCSGNLSPHVPSGFNGHEGVMVTEVEPGMSIRKHDDIGCSDRKSNNHIFEGIGTTNTEATSHIHNFCSVTKFILP